MRGHRRARNGLIAGAVLIGLAAPVAVAADAGPGVTCAPANGGDRSTTVLTPGTTLNQVSVWATVDTGPDEVGAHVEPWHRQAYFVDAGVGADGSGAAAAAVEGDDGEGPGYAAAQTGTEGTTCVGSPLAGAGVTTADDEAAGQTLPARLAVVAVPGSASAGYVTRTVPVVAGDGVDFLNLDTAAHDVISVARDDTGRPRFRSAFLNFGQSGPVEGVEALPSGAYPFYCTVHPNMVGSVVVQELPGEATP